MVPLLSHARSAGLSVVFSAVVLTTLPAQQVDVWSRPVQVERSRTFDYLHYRVSLTLDLDAQTFHGENRITLTPLAAGLDRFELDAEGNIVWEYYNLTGDGRIGAVYQVDRLPEWADSLFDGQ